MPEKVSRNVKKCESGAREKRIDAHLVASARLRKQNVSFKRRPQLEGDAEAPNCTQEELATLVNACASSATDISKPSEPLAQLRRALSRQDDEVIGHVLDLGGLAVLAKFLEVSACPQNQLEAVWCITNIATGTSEQTGAVLSLAPILVQLLSIESPALQEQCVWALGNMAGDNREFRDRVRANGALVPVVRLLHSPSRPLARTCCWAISNLCRGPDPRLHELFAAGAGDALARLLVSPGLDDDLLVEVAWALTYLTHGQADYMAHLARAGGLRALAGLLQRDAPAVVTPALRTLGNLVSGPDELTDAALAEPGLAARLVALLRGEHKAIKKECAWVISNICAGTDAHRDAMVAAGAGEGLMETLSGSHFDIRKEAAFALYHLAADPRHAPAVLTHSLISEAVSLLRAPDPEVQDLALTLVERGAAGVEGGAAALEAAGGIDALEGLAYSHAVPPQLAARAAAVVDRYFGDPGPDE